jgi:Cu2+-exporting ATPase
LNAAQEALADAAEWDGFTRWSGDGDSGRTGESTLRLAGLRCAACGPLIESTLKSLPGVLDARASTATSRLVLRWDPRRTRPTDWLRALHAHGYDAVPDLAGPAREQRRREQRRELWRLFVAAFCAMQVMMFATPAYVAGPGELDDNMRQLLAWGGWLCSLPVLMFSAGPFLRGAWTALRFGRMSMDVPVSLGIVITFVAGTIATFDPAGPLGGEVYFDSMTMFVALLLGARALELRARHRAAAALEERMARLPEMAQRIDADGSAQVLPLRALRAGDVVRVAVGDAFPADGAVDQGQTWVDEALLSGESTPVARAIGQPVVAGSINLGAPVLVRVQRLGADTRMQRIAALMEQAFATRPRAARIADRIARPFLWAVLLAAAAAAAIWSTIDPARAWWVAVAVLIVTCPCALTLAVPMTLVSAAGGLARRGVLLQRLDALETLADAKRLYIDKTGTLTLEEPRLSAARDGAGAELDAATLGLAASLAAWSTHPLSRAIGAAARPELTSAHWSDVRERPGRGLQARDEMQRAWRLGAPAWASGHEGAAIEAADPDAQARVSLTCEGRVVATFEFQETLRPDAAEALQRLRKAGWTITLLSGDSLERARAVAARLGLGDVRAPVSPEGKLAELKAARMAGVPVVMLGDGINDAPALAAADVSLAMGQGALMARSGADAVLTTERLAALPELVETATRARRVMRQNLAWAAIYNAASVPLALAGWLPPWLAGLGMACSSLLVVLNARRAGFVAAAD